MGRGCRRGEEPLVTYSFKLRADALEAPAYDVVHEALSHPNGRFGETWLRLTEWVEP
jgi:hypothetical protein